MNKNLKNSRISIVFIFLLYIFTFIGCKDEAIQEPEINNNQTPVSPQLSEPANNSVAQTLTPLLKWTAFENAQSYRVQLSMDANFLGTLCDTSLNSLEYSVPSQKLITGINYYWRVYALLSGGQTSTASSVWKFSVILPPPQPPVLLLPGNNSINVSFLPFFDWEDSPTAQTYRIQISGNSSFTQILFDSSGINISSMQCRPMIINTNTQYYWRVMASNSNGLSNGDWSVTFNFTTVTGPEPNSISGTITFVDNLFISSPYYYFAGAYLPQSWPPNENSFPVKFDSLRINPSGSGYIANYKISGLENGPYHIASGIKTRTIVFGGILGTYGCDTNRIIYSNCAVNTPQVTITGNNGVTGIDFKSWSDTTKLIFEN